MSTTVANEIESLTREEAEKMAAAVLRAMASESMRRHRDVVTATSEASQLVQLAVRLEGFAAAESS
jgi:hypothetical protein